jgi:hypothetical protein
MVDPRAMHQTLFAALLLTALAVLYGAAPASGQIVTCAFGTTGYCNGTIRRCNIGQKCCNGGKLNAACTANTTTCPPAIECSQQQCGLSCAGAPVYCNVGYVCCNSCKGRNICVLPGGACDQGCDPCPANK